MRRKILIAAVLATCEAALLTAQPPNPHPAPTLGDLLHHRIHRQPASASQASPAIFDATNLGSPVLLDKGWRVGITSDAGPADPVFDDSGWAVRDAQSVISDIPDNDNSAGTSGKENRKGFQHRFAWFRLHLTLAPHHGPVALLIELPVTQTTSVNVVETDWAVDVFANGKRIQPEGPHADLPQHYQQISRIYNLNLDPNETSLVLALRTPYIPFGFSAYTGFFSNRNLRLGNHDDLDRFRELWAIHTLFERLPRLIDSILLIILAVFLLALYFSQKGHIEYLWLALYELLQAPIGFVELAGSTARLDSLWYAGVVLQLVLLSAYLYFEFLIAFLALRPRWYIKTLRYSAPVLVLVGPTLLLVGHGHSETIGIALVIVFLLSFLWIFGWILFIFLTLIVATLRRNFEAGLLLIPLVLSMVGLLEPALTAGVSEMSGHPYRSPLTIQAGPIPIHFAAIADFTGILVIVLIIFVRFLRIHRDQERASSELAAARSVQELMIPQERIQTPGFEVVSVYSPANEVGGDFFHVQSTADGGLLIVVGDVAGKGLQAAMNVSMLMGALRRIEETSPARILASLNRVLVGTESFTTCQAAWFGANGELLIANAGHLPPYLNSQEIALPSGLPLGFLPEANYEEARLFLHPGDRLLMISDGVVEARKPSGELFGFDRVHNLSNQTAFYIADAAKEFGQEDDITVLTVRRLAMEKAA